MANNWICIDTPDLSLFFSFPSSAETPPTLRKGLCSISLSTTALAHGEHQVRLGSIPCTSLVAAVQRLDLPKRNRLGSMTGAQGRESCGLCVRGPGLHLQEELGDCDGLVASDDSARIA